MAVMAVAAAGVWIGVVLAFATDNMAWMLMAVVMFAIAHIADRIDDKLRARARRFE